MEIKEMTIEQLEERKTAIVAERIILKLTLMRLNLKQGQLRMKLNCAKQKQLRKLKFVMPLQWAAVK